MPDGRKKWTAAEDDVIREERAQKRVGGRSWYERAHDRMPNRTQNAITQRAFNLQFVGPDAMPRRERVVHAPYVATSSPVEKPEVPRAPHVAPPQTIPDFLRDSPAFARG